MSLWLPLLRVCLGRAPHIMTATTSMTSQRAIKAERDRANTHAGAARRLSLSRASGLTHRIIAWRRIVQRGGQRRCRLGVAKLLTCEPTVKNAAWRDATSGTGGQPKPGR